MTIPAGVLNLATSSLYSDPSFGIAYKRPPTPQEIYDHCFRIVGDLGMTLAFKRSTKLRLSKLTTTYYQQIRLGTNFPAMPLWLKAETLAHELVHARQWRGMGRIVFGSRYLSAWWRWAIEMGAFGESVRVRTLLGISELSPSSSADRYIEGRPGRMREIYKLDRLPPEMDQYTIEILTKIAEQTGRLLR